MSPTAIGPYRIFDVLGQGGMGVVYRGVHSESGEPAAVKTVRLANAAMLAGFRREVRALSALRHPGVVRVVADGIQDGIPWYAMELLQGVTLRQYTTATLRDLFPQTLVDPLAETLPPDVARPTLPTRELPPEPIASTPVPPVPPHVAGPRLVAPVLGIIRRLCHTLAYVHGEGIVHRDVKPENVFVLSGGRPVLVDFGLATSFAGREELDVAKRLAGTIAYMAPEQARGEPVDARADLYALGCVLYELVTGRPPFVHGSALDIVNAHLEARPAPPSALVADVWPALEECILQLLAKRPADRIGHASDVASVLASLGAEGEPDPNAPEARPYLYRPGFSGRGHALGSLMRRMASAEGRHGAVVLVSGESGAGKTRLAMELARVAQRNGVVTLVGECAPIRATSAGTPAGAPPLGGLRKPIQAIADRCREIGPLEAARVLGSRARILALYEPALRGIPGADATPRLFAESAMDFRTQLYLAIAETLEALADAEPVLLVIDDLQWGDELTIGFLEMALRGDRFARSALLVLGTFRSEEVSPSLVALVDAAGGDVAELERLTDDEIAAIAGDMLSTIPPPATLARLICDRAAGNPFFAAEYLRAAVDEGLLRRDSNGRWITTDSSPTIEEIALPPTLRELLELRIRGLSAPSSQVAAALAVLGRDADVALVERMLGSDDLSHALTDLIRRHVVEESRPGRLGFAHDKLRELSYEGLGGPDRVRLHRAAAEALEASGLAWRGATLAELGHHWEIAGEPDKAARYYLSGAKASAARYALSEAARLYSAYFRIAPSNTAERADAHGRFGRTVLRPQGLVAETAREYEIALEEARSAGARTIEGVVLRWRGALLYETGRLDDAAVDYAAALEIARGLHDREAEGRALTNLGALAHERGRLEEAADLYERALSVRTNLSAAITNLALLRQQQGRLDDARALYRGALAAASDRGDLVTEATVAMNLAILEKESGQFDAAAARYDQALALARSTGNRRMEGMVLGNRADLQWDAGELDAARTLYVQALAIHREVGNRRFEGVVLSNLATAYAEHGDLDAARSAYRDALVIHRDVGDRRFVGITLTEQATLERRAGNLDDAELLLGEAERVVNAIGEKLHRALALCARAHLELANGRSATPEIEAARALADDLGARAESHLGRTVAAAERAHQAFDSGATLRFGEVAADSGRN